VYLTENYTGEYSRIEYGKKGDKVNVIEVKGNMALVEGNGKRYHVKVDKLSEKEVEGSDHQEIIEPKIATRPKWTGQTKKKPSNSKPQNKLF
jgi:hypothetical protein